MTDDRVLIKSVSVTNVVAQRNAIAAKIRDASELLSQAADLAEGLNTLIRESTSMAHHQTVSIESACFEPYRRHSIAAGPEGADAAIAKIDASLWDLLLKESGMRSFMDAEARATWDAQVHEGRHPTLSVENVAATFRALNDGRSDMFARGLVNTFKKLNSWDYKTNNPRMFGDKIILSHGAEPNWSVGWKVDLSYEARNRLADLERVFCVVDGKPEPDHRDQFPHTIERGAWVDFPYFKLKGFKKGSIHIAFTRPELVDELNKALASACPNALPPATVSA